MSIPKEPRQLMINLMYLVLTAMLALNVSAEIIMAFFKIDDNTVQTNGLLAKANEAQTKGIAAEVEKKPQYKPMLVASEQATQIVKEFNSYIESLRSELTKEAGGLNPDDYEDRTKAGRPVNFKNKEIPTRLFVSGEGDKKPIGPELKARIQETHDKLIGLIESLRKSIPIDVALIKPEEIEQLKKDLSLKVDDQQWKDYKKKSWEQLYFDHMPVAAVFPILSGYQNSARNAESSIINFLAGKMGNVEIIFDKFEPVSSPEKSYVIVGEKFATDVFLSTSSSQTDISVRVNGASVPLREGKGHYEATAGEVGEKSYKVDITVKNPTTNKIETYSKTFKYEVGRKSAAVSADKMNVFYIGVENPVTISVAGASSNQIKASTRGPISIRGTEPSKYIVTANAPSQEAYVVVTAPGMTHEQKFRVKEIPLPVAKIGGVKGGKMGDGQFKAQDGMIPELENFDFEAKCTIQSYRLVRMSKNNDPQPASGEGNRFSGTVKNLMGLAKAGDLYSFMDIKAKCPGWSAAKEVNSIGIEIK